MYELFVMALKEYWNEQGDTQEEVDKSVEELQNVLSEHYGCSVHWNESEPDPAKADDEIPVCAFTDAQFVSLQAVAAALELDGNIDDLDIDAELPWDSEIFARLDKHMCGDDDDSDEEVELKKFPHILNMGQSAECFIVPSDLPFVAQLSTNDDDDDDDDHCDHCDDDHCDCCDEDDESCIEISSLPALRRELNVIGEVLGTDPNVTIENIDGVVDNFKEDDMLREAKIAWYLLNARVNDALRDNLPLILHYDDETGDDYEDDVD